MEPFALWTAAEAAAATSGRNTAEWVAAGVSIDSRTLEYNDLFVALEGPNQDGHNYVAAALKAGAAAAIVRRIPDGLPGGAPLLLVDDTLEALNRLGEAARQRVGADLIAVTGSVGKTGTKEALRHCLGEQGPTHASAGSYNNHWGVPLSLARMPQDTQFGIFEVGMNHPGEILPLTRMIRPDVAIITTVEGVHIENFSSLRAIADAKAEIFAGMSPDGTAILNRDNPHFTYLAERARAAGVENVWGFGSHAEANVRLVNFVLHPTCSCVSADIDGQAITYKVGSPGRHWVMNSLAVLAAAKAVDADLGVTGLALATMTPPQGRGRRHHLDIANGAIELIDDSYNASPVSMRAAFETLSATNTGARGRRIAVLGDMLELGEQSAAMHAALAEDIAGADIDLVFTAGTAMQVLFDNLPLKLRGQHAADADLLAQILLPALRTGDVVLVKGSHGSRMGQVVAALMANKTPPRAANG